MDYSGRVHRLLRIITLVQSEREWTPKRLAQELGTAERTIYRDLDCLKTAGVPIVFDHETNQYRIVGRYFMPPVHLTAEEALALSALCEHIGEHEQIPFLRPAWRALHKIESGLPSEVREELSGRTRDITIQTGQAMPSDGYRDVYDTVQEALARRRRLVCKYESLRESAAAGQGIDGAGDSDPEFELCPYALFFSVRAWYVIGARSDRDELRCLKLNRFTKVRLTDRPYMVPMEFDLDSYLGNAWRMMQGQEVDVEIWFDAAFAQTMADTAWHRTQEVQWHEDDSATFRCTVAGLDEIEWWVLSMGPHCVVRRPTELVARVRALAAATAAQYEPTEGDAGASAQMPRSAADLSADRWAGEAH